MHLSIMLQGASIKDPDWLIDLIFYRLIDFDNFCSVRADEQRQRREKADKSKDVELCIIKTEKNKPLELDFSTMVKITR